MGTIFEDYIQGQEDILAFYNHVPHQLFELALPAPDWSPDVLEALCCFQEALGLKRHITGDEAVVITGQQAGIFTGPLYTIYKAVTTVLTAAKLEEKSGQPVLPLFWVASEDHDFEEVRTAHFLSKQQQLFTLTFDPAQSSDLHVAGMPVYRIPVDESLHRFIDDLAAQVPLSEHAPGITTMLHDTLNEAASVSDWHTQVMARLFQDTKLCFYVPHIHAGRHQAIPILEREITHPLASTRLLNEAGEGLKALGYTPQLVKKDPECNFFVEMGGRRRKVLYENGHFLIPRENMACSQDELLTMLHSAPERFSPNAALRCIIQQHLFPVAAYIGGPGEIAYWAQLKPLFEFFERPMPVVYPRSRALLTTTKLNKLRTRLNISAEDLTQPTDQLIDDVLRREVDTPSTRILANHRQLIIEAIDELGQELGMGAPNTQTAVEKVQGIAERVSRGLDQVERILIHEDNTKANTLKSQVSRLVTALYPDNQPQERVYSIFSFLFEYGDELIPKLLNTIDIGDFDVQEIEL